MYLLRLEQEIESIRPIIDNWSKYPELVFVCFFISYQKMVKHQVICPKVVIGVRASNATRMDLAVFESVENHNMKKGLQFVGKTIVQLM